MGGLYISNDNPIARLSYSVHHEPEVVLGNRYYLSDGYYFIVRKDLWNEHSGCQRACLYREDVVNEYMYGTREPQTVWISNIARDERTLRELRSLFEIKIANAF